MSLLCKAARPSITWKIFSSPLAQRNISTATLRGGATIPLLGFGTWQDKEHMEAATLHALKTGYRHLDCARVYGTEVDVGKALAASGVPRSEVFLTTKLWNNSHKPESVAPALQASLNDLGVDSVDLYLMHWPSAFADGPEMRPTNSHGEVVPGDTDFVDTWRAMEELQRSGLVKAIGVSNFSLGELKRLLKVATIAPAVHQMELHPYLQQKSFVQFHNEQGIHVTHYSPFGNQNNVYGKGQTMEKLIDDMNLRDIGRKYGKSGAQVALAWGINSGRSVIPKSKTPTRIEENFAADFELDADDMAKIATLDLRMRFNDPSQRFRWNFYSDLEGKDPEASFP